MTSSEPKMWLWIFYPQMTLHDIPKMSQIGVKARGWIRSAPSILHYDWLIRMESIWVYRVNLNLQMSQEKARIQQCLQIKNLDCQEHFLNCWNYQFQNRQSNRPVSTTFHLVFRDEKHQSVYDNSPNRAKFSFGEPSFHPCSCDII